jgi:membrane associated rhomboid family serine protease
MQNPALAWTLIGVGILIILISGLADPLGLGRRPGFGWIQGLGVIIGALVIAAGVYLRRGVKSSP